jgi:hypothetical protein
MSSKVQSLAYLRAIEKKHQKYFDENKLDILKFVVIINDGRYASVHLLRDKLPFEIKYDIESMFWR